MNNTRLLWLLFACSVFVYIVGLFPEVGIDSAKYAAVSRNIFETGDWTHLSIHGDPYLQKPPFMFWLSAISFHIFGLSMFAFKLPTLIFTIASVFALFKFAKLYFTEKTAFVAALMYLTSQMLFLYNDDLHTDAMLTANIVIGVSFLAHYIENRRLLNFILGFVFVGFATITKGVLGLAVCGFAVIGHLIFTKQWKLMFSPIWLLAIPILGAIIFLGIKGQYDDFGVEAFKFFFWGNSAGRIAGSHGMNKDYFFYLHTMLYIYLPWSGFACIMLFNHIKNAIKNKKSIFSQKEYYCYSLIIPFWLILTVAGQKAPHYMFPIIPFLSVLTANFVMKSIASNNTSTIKALTVCKYIIAPLLVIIVLLINLFVFPSTSVFNWIVTCALIAFLCYLLYANGNIYAKIIAPLAVASILLNFAVNYNFMPTAFSYHGVIRACDYYNLKASNDSKLYTYQYDQFESYFYPKNISSLVENDVELKHIDTHSGAWLIAGEKGKDDVEKTFADSIIERKVFNYKKISRMNGKFLNPKTREATLEKIYLYQIK